MEIWKKTENLPPLMYEKRRDRELIEQDQKVKVLLGDQILLDTEFNSIVFFILGQTDAINSLSKRISKEGWKDFFKIIKENIREKNASKYVSERNKRAKKRIIDSDKKIISTLSKFEKNKKRSFEILENHSLIICKKCKSVLCKDRFRTCSCDICDKNIINQKDCEEINIHIFNDNMIKFIGGNIWLERGINNLLSRRGFLTLTGVYILGNSGVKHEIDNFAEMNKENIRLLCECKTKDIKVNDIFVLSGKMQDTGINTGYIFTTAIDVNKEIRKLAKFRNITIIDAVLEKKDDTILEFLK